MPLFVSTYFFSLSNQNNYGSLSDISQEIVVARAQFRRISESIVTFGRSERIV